MVAGTVKHNTWQQRAAAAVVRLLPLRRARAEPRHVRREVWPHSTQRMGVRFTERVRDAFRHRWLKIVRPD